MWVPIRRTVVSQTSINHEGRLGLDSEEERPVDLDPEGRMHFFFCLEAGSLNAGKELPIINQKFVGEATRTTYVLKDTGTLPTGNVKQQIEKNDEQRIQLISEQQLVIDKVVALSPTPYDDMLWTTIKNMISKATGKKI